MRQLTTPRRGLTLVELLASLAITVILFGMAVPYMGDYMANTRLREAGNALHAEMLYAQGEALKRNLTTRLVVEGGDIQVRDMSDGDEGTLLRRRVLGEGVSVLADAQVDFNSRGMPVPFGTATAIDISKSGVICSAELRCPGLRVDGGGSVRLGANRLDCP
jgi:type IV fimbrial biogenesis protein FimT